MPRSTCRINFYRMVKWSFQATRAAVRCVRFGRSAVARWNPNCLTPVYPVARSISRSLAVPLLRADRDGSKASSDGPESHGAELGCVNGGGTPHLPWLHVPPSKVRVEVLNAVLANGGGREVRDGHGLRDVWTVMHPVRRAGNYVHGLSWCQGVRSDFWRKILDPPVGAVQVPVDLVPSRCIALEAPVADRLFPADLHQQAVLDVEVECPFTGGPGG